MDERLSRILLSYCPVVGPVRFRRLVEAFGSAPAALAAGERAWSSVEGFTSALAEALAKELKRAAASWEKERPFVERLGVRTLLPTDEGFPEGLKSLDDGPFMLYMKGDRRPADALAVAVVGTRRPTVYGRAAAERLAKGLAQAGVTVVSGLARGIDTAAHEAVLKQKGRTIGVLGSGFGDFYPPENRHLLEKISSQGAVVTEYPWSAEPKAEHFPRRNRIISGMTLGVVVVESEVKSGALITARLAAQQGRDVFAVPGSIFSPMSRGPHLLLKEGAHPVESAEDVLDALEVFRDLIRRAPKKRVPALPADVSPAEGRLLGRIALDPVGMDALAAASGMGHGVLSSALLSLELKGLVRALPGKTYVRTEASLS